MYMHMCISVSLSLCVCTHLPMLITARAFYPAGNRMDIEVGKHTDRERYMHTEPTLKVILHAKRFYGSSIASEVDNYEWYLDRKVAATA